MEEHHILAVTKLVNALLGKPALALLAALHITPADSRYPIPNHIAMEFVVFLFSVIFFLWLKRRLSVAHPGAVQQCMEMLITNPMGVGVRDMLDDIAGHGSPPYIAMLGSIGTFVLFCNLISLVPGFESPTAEKSVPLGCALVVFLYYHWCGVRRHGLGHYGRQFLGPVLPISPIMLVVETFSHLARVLSLTVRLYVNMFVSEILYAQFLALTLVLFLLAKNANPLGYGVAVFPLLAPLFFILLHIFVGVLQAFVFTILPVIYVGIAVAEEH